MTLTRYQIRNEYGLADKELYQAAHKEDPEALLEGASMAGLVGVLRQLGDLAEFAAEVFHCLHEEVMTTAARGHGLSTRLQQLEAEFPSVEIPLLSQTDHSTSFYDPGLEWRSNLQTAENMISPNNLPHCIMDSYEECRGPPHLFLLDKFDVVGSGSCLKRYSDPSLLKTRTASVVVATSILNKDERLHEPKKKGSHKTGGVTHGNSQTSHAKLHQLFDLEHVENGHRNHEYHVKLKRRQLNGPPINSSSGTGYMEKFLKNSSPYCERVHGTQDQSSPAMEIEVKVCSVREDLPIPSLVYPNSEDITTFNAREMESIADDKRLEKPFAPQEIMVNEKALPNIEGRPAICLERSFSANLCYNDTDAPAFTESKAKEAGSDDKAGSNLGFPGFGQTQFYPNADVTKTEVLAQLTPETDSAGMGSLELKQTPFSFACYENPPNNPDDTVCRLELQCNKASADEIGLESSQVFEVRRNDMLNNFPETPPDYQLKLTQVPLDSSKGGTKVILTNYVEDDNFQHVFSVETESEISLSALVEDQFSPITNQEIEALDDDISSEAGHSITDNKSSLWETQAALESDCLLQNLHISTFDYVEDLSLAAEAQDNAAPKEDETNSQDRSSMNTEQSGHISTFKTSSENGNENLSTSSWREDALGNADVAEISSDSGQEDPQTMSIITHDSSEPEVPIPDTQRHGTCFAGDVDHDNQTGLSNKASETVLEIELENIVDPQESLLGIKECFSPEYFIQTKDQGQESPSESGSENPIAMSGESLPTQDAPVGVRCSPSEEALTCNEELFPLDVTEIEALHAPHQETITSSNDHISEYALSMDPTDRRNCSDVSMVPLSTPLYETPEADPDIMLPLPPFPPTQWWMGKLVESVKTTEMQASRMPSLAGSGSYDNTHNGLVKVTETQYTAAASVRAGETHNFHDYTEKSRVEAVSNSAQTTLNEPSKATEEQSTSAVNGTSDINMNTDEGTPKCLNKTAGASSALVSLLTAKATPEARSAQGIKADWRSEATALEWFSQNLREQHTDPNTGTCDHPREATEETKFPQSLRDNNSYDQNEKVGREKDSLVIGIDRSMLRKVSEGNRTQTGARVDENDSILEIIRNKSFNLRPSDASVRPNFQVAVPITNLKVAAILEKANTLRQAMAGSDDSDSWSE